MRIKKIELKNIRNISYLLVDDLPDLVVIAGPNGAGKSTILDAINIWKQSVSNYSLRQWMNRDDMTNIIQKGHTSAHISIEVMYSTDDVEYLSQMNQPVVNTGSTEEVSLSILTDGSIQFQNRPSKHLSHLLRYPERKAYPQAPIFDYYGPNRFLPTNKFMTFNTDSLSLQNEQYRRIQPSFHIQQKSDNIKDYLYNLNQKDLEWFASERNRLQCRGQLDLENAPDSFNEIKEIIPELLPNLQFAEVKSGSPIQFLFRVAQDKLVDLDELSTGEKEILSLFLEIYRTRPCNSIVLIDEPELHLNQSVEARIVPYLYKNVIQNDSNQVFIITHSPGILASTPDSNLFRMDYSSDGEQNQIVKISTSTDRMEALKSIVGDLGIFTTNNKFIFLEGTRSDKSFDKRILEIMLPALKNKVTFIPSDNCKVVELVSKKVSEILEEEIPFGKFYAIRDRDRLPADEISKLEKHIPRFKVWPRCMIENFLMDAGAWVILLHNMGREYTSTQIEEHFRKAAVAIQSEEVNLRLNDYLVSKLGSISDFKDHPKFSTIEKLERLKTSVEEETAKLTAIKQTFEIQVSEELNDGRFILLYHGKNLLRELKKQLNLDLPDEFLIPLVTTTMYQNNLVPQDLVSSINELLS